MGNFFVNPGQRTLLRFLLLCTAVFFITACEDDTKQYLETDVIGCGGDDGFFVSGQDTIRIDYPENDPFYEDPFLEWSYQADEQLLSVTHGNVGFNCCVLSFRNWSDLDGDTIMLYETAYYGDSGPCRCPCLSTLTSRIPDIAPGTYTLEIYVGEIDPPQIVETIKLF